MLDGIRGRATATGVARSGSTVGSWAISALESIAATAAAPPPSPSFAQSVIAFERLAVAIGATATGETVLTWASLATILRPR